MKSLITRSASSIQSIAKAQNFSSVAKKMYSTGYSGISEELEYEFRKKFDPIAEEFSSHRALDHDLFKYLEEQSKEGFTPKQYEVYRDNFFRRTELTIPSIASPTLIVARTLSFSMLRWLSRTALLETTILPRTSSIFKTCNFSTLLIMKLSSVIKTVSN